jgi:hypothetical protein
LDLTGFGKIAKAIPPEVYTRTAKSALTVFEKVIAPITETTHGFGRYIRQKFDNMVEVEKAIAAFTIEKACLKAQKRASSQGISVGVPQHPKSFVKALEEASRETDPLLHEMWASLLASQLLPGDCHPHFVEILQHFSPSEAILLISLHDGDAVGENDGKYISIDIDRVSSWIAHAEDAEPKPWTASCILLIDFGFADLKAQLWKEPKEDDRPSILYRTRAGSEFLKTVSP